MPQSRPERWSFGDLLATCILVSAGLVALVAGMAAIGGFVSATVEAIWVSMGGVDQDGAQLSMARAAWVGVIVGIVTLTLLGLTLLYTHQNTKLALMTAMQSQQSSEIAMRSVEDARVFAEIQARAYVGVHSLTVDRLTTADFTLPPTIMITVANAGQTPARNMVFRLGWQNHEPTELLEVVRSEDHSVQELAAGHSIDQQVYCPDFVEDALMEAFFGDHHDSWVNGVIEYDDVFGKRRSTWFRWVLTGFVDGTDLAFSVRAPSLGNTST